MKKHILAVTTSLLVATTVLAQPPTRMLQQTRPSTLSPAVLERLNLTMPWYLHIPLEGQKDGLATFQMTGRELFVQTRAGLVVALDAETGHVRWRKRVGNPYQVPLYLAYNSRFVFVVNSTYLYSLDRETGQTQWHLRVPKGISAPPIADEEMIFLCSPGGELAAYYVPPLDLATEDRSATASRPGGESAGPRSTELYSGNKKTTGAVGPLSSSAREASEQSEPGPKPTLVWRAVSNLRLESMPLVTRDAVFVVSPNGTAVAYRKIPIEGTGAQELYRFHTQGDITVAPGQFGNTAYIGSEDANLYAIDSYSGKVDWRYSAGTPITHKPMTTDREVYVSSERHGLAALDRKTGLPLWRLRRGNTVVDYNSEADRFLASNPKFVYAADRSGRLLVLDRQRGTQLSAYDGTRDYKFLIGNELTDRLFLAAHNGILLCLHDREYAAPQAHRQLEDAAANAVRRKLDTLVSEKAGKKMSVRDALEQLDQKYKLKFRVAEQAFRQVGVSSVLGQSIIWPEMDKKPLSLLLQNILEQAGGHYQIVEDSILIMPTRTHPAAPRRKRE